MKPRGMERVRGTDDEEIELARKHLIALLKKPYYRVAAIRLKRPGKLTELLADRGGKPSIAKRSHGADRPKTRQSAGRGRPREQHLIGLEKLLNAIDRRQDRKLIDWCRLIVRYECPSMPEERRESTAKQLQRKLLDLRQRKKS